MPQTNREWQKAMTDFSCYMVAAVRRRLLRFERRLRALKSENSLLLLRRVKYGISLLPKLSRAYLHT